MNYKLNHTNYYNSPEPSLNIGMIFFFSLIGFSLICFFIQKIKLFINNYYRLRILPIHLSYRQNNNSEVIVGYQSNNQNQLENPGNIIIDDQNQIGNDQNQIRNDQLQIDSNLINESLKLYSNVINTKEYTQNEECIICSDYLHENEIRIFSCLHKFHKKCIDDWFLLKKTLDCPICNQRIDKFEKSEIFKKIINCKNLEIDTI